MHRIYGLPFKTPALVVEKDALFIPSGWDSEKKISILYDNIQSVSPDHPFAEVIVKPSAHNASVKDTHVSADDDQTFLTKMQAQLNQSIPCSANSAQTPNFRPSPSTVKNASERRGLGSSPTPSQVSPLEARRRRLTTHAAGSEQRQPRRRRSPAELLQQFAEPQVSGWRWRGDGRVPSDAQRGEQESRGRGSRAGPHGDTWQDGPRDEGGGVSAAGAVTASEVNCRRLSVAAGEDGR